MAKRRPKRGFQFDVGFTLDGPEGITEKVEQATADLQQVEGKFGELVLDKLREPARIVTDLQKQPVAEIDARLDSVTSTVNDLQSRVESDLLGKLGSVGEKLDYLGIVAAPPMDGGPLVADAAQPATEASDGLPVPELLRAPVEPATVAQFDMVQGERFVPLPRVVDPRVPAAPPAGIPPQGNWPPIPRNGVQSSVEVWMNCDTLEFFVWSPLMRVNVPPRTVMVWFAFAPPATFADAEAKKRELERTWNRDRRCRHCVEQGMVPGPACGGGAVPPPPPPPPAAPLPPPGTVPPPTGPTCPPPPPQDPKDWRVTKNTVNCEYYPQKMSEALPGPSWEVFQDGLTQNQAVQLARKLTEQDCATRPDAGIEPNPVEMFDPVCDPVGYCTWYAGNPVSPGDPEGNVEVEGPKSVFGIDLKTLEDQAGFTGRLVGYAGAVIAGGLGRILKIADKLFNSFIWPRCKNQAGLVKGHFNLFVLDWLTLFLGKSIRRVGTPSEYIVNASCPMLFPDQNAANEAFLRGTITKDTWECWVAMNNFCPAPQEKILEAKQRRLTIDEGIDLYYQQAIDYSELENIGRYNGIFDPEITEQIVETRRGKFSPADVVRLVHRDLVSETNAVTFQRRNGFTSEVEYEAIKDLNTPHFDPDRLLQLWLREKVDDEELQKTLFALGWQRDGAVERWKELANFIPPYTDLTRFMVRDVADQDIVDTFGMDTDFNKKFDKEVKEWAKKQGISEDVMKYVWRAHWTIPSPTQLFQMYHRFRRPDNKYGIVIDKDTVKTALQQQDILPFWIEPILALSFNPLTRIDVRRAYEIGAINLDEVFQAYTELGYSDDNARTLANFSKKLFIDKLKRSPQVMKAAKLEWTIDNLSDWLDGFDMGPEDKQIILDEAWKLSARMSNAKCVKSVRQRFFAGELDRPAAIRSLTNLGHGLDFADTTVNGWSCELESKSKQAQAGQLCKWYEIGLITDTDFVKRLQRIGWTEKDALNIVAECTTKLMLKAGKEQERLRKEAERETQKKLRELEKAAEKAGKAAAKERAERLKQIKAAADRDAAIVKYAKVHADRFGLSIPLTYQEAVSALSSVQQSFELTDDQVVFVMKTAVEGQPRSSEQTLPERISVVAAALASGLADNPQG